MVRRHLFEIHRLEEIPYDIMRSFHLDYITSIFVKKDINPALHYSYYPRTTEKDCRYLMLIIFVNPFQTSVVFNIETSHLLCSLNQMTGFCIKCNYGL